MKTGQGLHPPAPTQGGRRNGQQTSHPPPAQAAKRNGQHSHSPPAQGAKKNGQTSHPPSAQAARRNGQNSHPPPAYGAKKTGQNSHPPSAQAAKNNGQNSHPPPAYGAENNGQTSHPQPAQGGKWATPSHHQPKQNQQQQPLQAQHLPQQHQHQQQQQQQQQQPTNGNRGQRSSNSRPGRFTILRRRRAQMAKRSEVGICTKYTLFFENFILFLLGLALLVIGAYILVLKQKVLHDALGFFLDPACIMCLGGALTSVLAFLGCTGALREITCFLKLFHSVLGVFLFLELAGAVLFFLMYYVQDVREALFPQDAFSQAIVHYRDDRDMQDLIDSLQSSLGCCGMSDSDTGYEDWNKNIYFNCSQSNQSPEKCTVPPSCCKIEAGQLVNLYCGANIYKFENGQRITYDVSKIYTAGCLKALEDWLSNNSLVLGGVLLGILLPQIFIICLSRNLYDMINAQKSKWER